MDKSPGEISCKAGQFLGLRYRSTALVFVAGNSIRRREAGTGVESLSGRHHAASRDIAFGKTAYYSAASGEKLGEFGFGTTQPYPDGKRTAPPAITVSPDGRLPCG